MEPNSNTEARTSRLTVRVISSERTKLAQMAASEKKKLAIYTYNTIMEYVLANKVEEIPKCETSLISIRVTPSERKKLEQMANKCNVTTAKLMHKAITEKIKQFE